MNDTSTTPTQLTINANCNNCPYYRAVNTLQGKCIRFPPVMAWVEKFSLAGGNKTRGWEMEPRATQGNWICGEHPAVRADMEAKLAFAVEQHVTLLREEFAARTKKPEENPS